MGNPLEILKANVRVRMFNCIDLQKNFFRKVYLGKKIIYIVIYSVL